MVVFGDSWSSTGFDIEGDPPSASLPIGNPPYPGRTVTNGANWVDYLVYERNESKILALDLAVGGATIDTTLIAPGMPLIYIKSFKEQVEEWETYNFTWKADSSLYTIWFGVNDITAYTNETSHNFEAEFKVMVDLMDKLYAAGVRNFLIFNAPPLERSPIFTLSGTEEWKEINSEWNVNVTAVVSNFTKTYDEASTFFFDAHTFFNTIMDDPCSFEESCGFEVTTDTCEQYFFGATTPDYKDPKCPYSVDKYIWINPLHPSSKMHKTIARAVYDALSDG